MNFSFHINAQVRIVVWTPRPLFPQYKTGWRSLTFLSSSSLNWAVSLRDHHSQSSASVYFNTLFWHKFLSVCIYLFIKVWEPSVKCFWLQTVQKGYASQFTANFLSKNCDPVTEDNPQILFSTPPHRSYFLSFPPRNCITTQKLIPLLVSGEVFAVIYNIHNKEANHIFLQLLAIRWN